MTDWSRYCDFAGDAEAEALFRPFLLERFSEIEEDGHVASGEPKHWHVLHVVARKL